MTRQMRPYGSWPSPISARMLGSALRLLDVQWDTDGQTLVWLEGRGDQGVLVMRQGDDAPCDLTSDLSVRARVGYGGGDFTVAHGAVYFAGPDGRLYRQALAGGSAAPITPAFGVAAAPRLSPDARWLVYVHSYEDVDGLALVDAQGEAWPAKLAYGTDFVMQPAWHPQGRYLAYVAWNQPRMPWDGTELRLLHLDYEGGVPGVTSTETVIGDDATAVFQPEFSPDGRYLSYVSDPTGWGQLYVYDLETRTRRQLTHAAAEHGLPAWAQGQRTYGWSSDSRFIYSLRSENAIIRLWRYQVRDGRGDCVSELQDYTAMSQPAVSAKVTIAMIASSSGIPPRIITFTPESELPPVLDADAPTLQIIVDEPVSGVVIQRRATSEHLTLEQVSTPRAISWNGHDGEPVYGLYYAPCSSAYHSAGLPPLIVRVHGGPTGQAIADYRGDIQFFTSRGYAVLDVNYRGSTGYGRAYMTKLRGNWGVCDVEDCATGAAWLADEGLADPARRAIMGTSAGGFTVLQSLVTRPGFYRAGVCGYGVANQFLIAMETHKFEACYLDMLLGPLPESAALYRERSPFFHADQITDPLIVFQGDQDQVVPRSQSDMIVSSLRRRGVPHEYHVFEGEGHGWRRPETIEAYYTYILAFLRQHVLFS